ncbi:MAG TPA: hypothetical protein VFG54_07090 [Prolixibacteraceae bacterium]|nr:hypothetical protein [Prolixibacteraceae bacterium]
MRDNNQELEKEVHDLIGNGFSGNSAMPVNALEAACLILDHKFGKDFHKKNPKLAVRFAESIMKNIRMKDFRDAIQNDVGENLYSIRAAIQKKDVKSQGALYEEYADSFRF